MNLQETYVSMTGDSPRLRILAQLIPTVVKEEMRVKLYTSLDPMESPYSSDDRSIGLSKIFESIS